MCCGEGGEAEMEGTVIADSKQSGVLCDGEVSRVMVQRGHITGSQKHDGVHCRRGGHVDLVGVEIADCNPSDVFCDGVGSRVTVQGGHIAGSKELHGVYFKKGGHAEVVGVEIADCKQYGLCRVGNSTLTHSECTLSRCKKGSAFRC